MLQLPNVSLVIFNPAHGSELSASIVRFLTNNISFGEVVHLADRRPDSPLPANHIDVPKMGWQEAQRWQAIELHKYFSSPFMLHIETDGFPINFNLWDKEFLAYDYIGAPWPKHFLKEGQNRVGNGGCSIQSRKFRQVLWENRSLYKDGIPSDVFFVNKEMMEIHEKEGIRIAPVQTALRFSYENPIEEFPEWSHAKSFAFHGKSYECTRMVADALSQDTHKSPLPPPAKFSAPQTRLAFLNVKPHDGMGDHLICNGLYRKLASTHNRIALFIKGSLMESVKFMLRDVQNIDFIRQDDWSQMPPERPLLGLGMFEGDLYRWAFVQGFFRCTWEHTFYHQCGLDPSLKWDGFHVERDRNREEDFAKKINPSGEPYLLYMSRGSDGKDRIDPSDLPKRLRRIEVKPSLSANIFDWCGLIERAEEIHSIDSSLKWMAEFFPTKGRLFYHTLKRPRQNPPHPHVSRKYWKVV